ncbi:MAG: ABC transporter ATP-binding protein [Gemmatimonadaceae bacterium]
MSNAAPPPSSGTDPLAGTPADAPDLEGAGTTNAVPATSSESSPSPAAERVKDSTRVAVPLNAPEAPPLPGAPETGGVRKWLLHRLQRRRDAEPSTISPATVREVHENVPAEGAARPPVIEFRNVTKIYDDGHLAIKDVTFHVDNIEEKGEFVTLLGPSGCGKSTILRLIAGLTPQYPATSGEVLVMGAPVQGPGADRGMVFQDYTAFDNRTVLDNVAFGLECQGVDRDERYERARETIGKVGLDAKRDQYKFPHQLSGGMRQRVAIAGTLILRPKIILMDEPFGALDPATRYRMQDLLVGLWRELEATIFFVTHSIEEAVYLGDRTLIFSPGPGRLIEQLEVPAPDRPAKVMQREPEFLDVVFAIKDMVEKLDSVPATP